MRLLLLLWISCCFVSCGGRSWQRSSKGVVNHTLQERMMHHVYATRAKFHYEDRIFLEDSSFFYGEGKIYGVRLDLSTMALLELKEARELLVDLVDDFLVRVNSDPILKPHLYQGALSGNSMTVYLNFQCNWGFYVDYDYVGWVTLEGGCSKFYAFDMRTLRSGKCHFRTEPYRESREIVRISREETAAYLESVKKDKSAIFGQQRFRGEEN